MENMIVEKKSQGEKTYIKIVPEKSDMIVMYQLLMITGNQISNFVEVSRIQNNDDVALLYDITDMISLSEIMEKRKLRAQEFRSLIETIVNTEKNARSYQLVNRGILVNPDYIFFSKDQKDIRFIYLPFYNEDSDAAVLSDLLKNLILDKKVENANDNFAMKLINIINSDDNSFSAYGKLFKKPNTKKLSSGSGGGGMRGLVPPPDPSPVPGPVPGPIPGSIPKHEPGPVPKPKPGPTPSDPHNVPPIKKGKKKNESTLKNIVFILACGVVVVILGLLYTYGFFTDNGSLKIEYIAGAVLVGGAVLFILFRELFVNHKEEKADKKTKGKKQKSPENKKSIPKPMPKSDSRSKSVPVPPKPHIPSAEQRGSGAAPQYDGGVNPYDPPYLPKENGVDVNNPADDSEETVLMDTSDGYAYLEYSEHGITEKFYLNRDKVLVGRQKKSVQYAIPNNMVSKVHAEFGADIEGYYVMDRGTPNGTYINDGERLEPRKKYYILDGDVIRLAKTELIFHC